MHYLPNLICIIVEIWFALSSKSDLNCLWNLVNKVESDSKRIWSFDILQIEILMHYPRDLICIIFEIWFVSSLKSDLLWNKVESDDTKIPKIFCRKVLKFITKESFLWTPPRQYWEGVGKQILNNRVTRTSCHVHIYTTT